MRHIIKIIMLILIVVLFAAIYIAHADTIDLPTIASVESSGNPGAYNKASRATGLYQITEICLMEYNNYHPYMCFDSLDDMYNPAKAHLVANWYMNTRIPQMLRDRDSLENRLICYNWGYGKFRKWYKKGANKNDLPEETRDYVKKYLERR